MKRALGLTFVLIVLALGSFSWGPNDNLKSAAGKISQEKVSRAEEDKPMAALPNFNRQIVAICKEEAAYPNQTICRWNNLNIEYVQTRILNARPRANVPPNEPADYAYNLIIKAKDRTLNFTFNPGGCGSFVCMKALTGLSDCAHLATRAQQGAGHFSFYAMFLQGYNDPFDDRAKESIAQLQGQSEATIYLGNNYMTEMGCYLNSAQ